MEQISGGVRWGGGSESDWDAYAATLGVADFQTRTTSDLTPSVLFQKFLDDAAVETCRGWMSAVDGGFGDLVDMTATDRVSVARDVSRLRRHIQGRPADEEVPIIDDYVELFGSVYRRTESQQTSWETVCVAMFTHPDFFMD